MKTTAQKISSRLDDDGQRWDTEDGVELDTMCYEAISTCSYRDGYGTDVKRWVFADNSAITMTGGGWDLGYADCYCWRGEGHQGTDCPQSPDFVDPDYVDKDDEFLLAMVAADLETGNA